MVSRVRFAIAPDIQPLNITDSNMTTTLLSSLGDTTIIYTPTEVIVTLTFTVGLIQVCCLVRTLYC
jgi:hypothetical protein